MKKFFLCLVAALWLAGCKDTFDTADLHEEAKLVVNCFPSTEDTTWIEVTHSIPMSEGAKVSLWDDYLEVEDAHIIYKVNGEQRTVGWKDRIYDRWQQPRSHGRYYVAGAHQPGDRVEVVAAASGCASVHAETVVVETVPGSLQSIVKTKVYDGSWGESREVYQLSAIFTDPADTKDYYAVRVRCKHYGGGTAIGKQWPDSLYSHPKILTASEPLLRPLSDLDDVFGFASGYYQNFCIFSDAEISGLTYTLHLNIWPNHVQSPLDTYTSRPLCYQVQLYHLTPEMYRYVKSVNDIDNNDLAQFGLTMFQPTYSNVHGGIGVVGAYSVSESGWMQRKE